MDTHGIDLTPIITVVVTLAATMLSAFGSWAFAALARKIGLQISQQQQDQYDSALHKLVTLGATKSLDLVKTHGWDHAVVKDNILREALSVGLDKFPDAMKGVGIVASSPDAIPKLRDGLARAYPLSMTSIVASPVTPPAEPGSQVAAVDVSSHEVKT